MACKQALVMSSHDDDRRALRSERPPRTAKRTTRSLIQRASVWIMFTTLLSRKRPSNPGPHCSQLSVPCVVRVSFVSKAISGTSTCIEDPLRPRPGPVGPGPGVLLNVGVLGAINRDTSTAPEYLDLVEDVTVLLRVPPK